MFANNIDLDILNHILSVLNTDTVLHAMDLRVYNQILSLDPGENQKPHGLFQDYNSEFLASPTI